ncbi:rRNA N6-adenosine-methyltransferase METTL5 isoform X1 [Centruroides vittatus]|uniref:rRNA N6-adenosine-methyltransferase METTL5 isoform X1 n=2 Tax=Centruroides vittatus TaxID=120091 RepID=UPI00350F9FD6
MKLKELKSLLQQMETFHKSKYQLEQYTTPADIAAKMLYMIHTASGLGNAVADLGCGCGILAIGASLLGADICIGVDVDDEALSVCLANCEKLEVTNVDLVQMDVVHLADSRWSKVFDTVVMNPPFGTKKRKGIDMIFLKTALGLAKTAVYSMHKTSTREHIKKKADDWGVNMEIIEEFKFGIPATYRFHKRAEVHIDVDLIKFTFKDKSCDRN